MDYRYLPIVFTAVLFFGATAQAQTVGLELGLVQARTGGGGTGSGRRIAFDLLDRFAPYGRDLLSFVSQRLFSRGMHADGTLQEEEIDSETIEAVWQFMWPATYRWHPWFGGGVGYREGRRVNRYQIERSGYLVERLPDESQSGPVIVAVIDVAQRYGPRLSFGVDVRCERLIAPGRWLWALSLTLGY